ncbi:hypothetical protein ACUDA6_13825 [Pseudomonas ceruminis]|uniref:hypothetical protein n=1 Tax=Pseudomonas putida group TaxID=136845 RepID=UPI003D07AE70
MYQVELIASINIEEEAMRNWGWFMTALGCAGLFGALAMVVAVILGSHDRFGQMLGMSLVITAASLMLTLIGGRLRARGKPLLPIFPSS